MPMAEISHEAHSAAKAGDGAIKDVIDRWANSHDVLEQLELRVVSMGTLTGDERPNDERATRPNEPDVLTLHKPTLSAHGQIVPGCGWQDPDAMSIPTGGVNDLPEYLGAPTAEVKECGVCFDQ